MQDFIKVNRQWVGYKLNFRSRNNKIESASIAEEETRDTLQETKTQ